MDRVPKSLKAVMFPQEFEAFRGVPNASAFEMAWEANRPCVLAHMAHAAYFDSPEVAAIMEGFAASATHWLEENETQGFLAVWKDKAVLAFRGTEVGVLADLLADINLPKDPLNGAEIHRGFRLKLEALWARHIERCVDDLASAGIPVSVTGHSLGGAMSTVAGLMRPFHEVVTFGEPRVGSGLDAAFAAQRHVRYVNGMDQVPRMPPEILGYQHHGEAVKLTDPDGPSPIYDHSIIYYSEILGIEKR